MGSNVTRFSERVIDLAERLENVADAAEGKNTRRAPRTRWLLLPAAGAGLYALVTSGKFTRQAKDVVGEAKARASDLPDELVNRLHEATSSDGQKTGRQSSRKTGSRSGGQRRKATSS
jgi:hypothetical protein